MCLPTACPISWTAMPCVMQPKPREIVCLPPLRPTELDQQLQKENRKDYERTECQARLSQDRNKQAGYCKALQHFARWYQFSESEARVSEQILSADVYPSIFLPQIEANVFIVLKLNHSIGQKLSKHQTHECSTYPPFPTRNSM